jgi:hypothetical protein
MLIFIIPDEKIADLLPNRPRYVGGWSDRLKGLLYICSLAGKLGHKVGIYWNTPVSWNLIIHPTSDILAIPPEEMRRILLKGAPIINLIDGKEEPEPEEFTYGSNYCFFANSIYCGSEKKARIDFLRHAFPQNFRFSNLIESQADRLAEALSITELTNCLAIHFRAGGYIGSPWRDPFIDARSNLDIAIKVGLKHFQDFQFLLLFSDFHPTTHYKIKRDHPNSWSLELKGQLPDTKFHFERTPKQSEADALSTLAEFVLLGRCKAVVFGEGEFGLASAAIGQTETFLYYPEAMNFRQRTLRAIRNRAQRLFYSFMRKFI